MRASLKSAIGVSCVFLMKLCRITIRFPSTVSADEAWLYCAFVEDLFSRKIVGWGMDEAMPQELTQTVLYVALSLRALGPHPSSLTYRSNTHRM